MDLKYNLEGKYEKLTGGVFVKEDDLTKSAVFRVYVDGVLKYVSPKVTSGQMYSFNVNVSDGQELVLKVEDQNHDFEIVAFENCSLSACSPTSVNLTFT